MEDRAHGQQKTTKMVNTTGLEENYFYHGPGMKNKWMESNKALLNLVSINNGQSVNVSLDAGELVVAEVDEIILKKFETEKDKNDHISKLEILGKK